MFLNIHWNLKRKYMSLPQKAVGATIETVCNVERANKYKLSIAFIRRCVDLQTFQSSKCELFFTLPLTPILFSPSRKCFKNTALKKPPSGAARTPSEAPKRAGSVFVPD